jgi:Holliday junction resolvasome RuvABC endonuclease subunit
VWSPRFVIGIDPGFRSIGWCVMCWDGSRWAVLAMGVISTEETGKVHKAKNVRMSSSVLDRAAGAVLELENLLMHWKPVAVCFEDVSYVRSASTMFRMGTSYGGMVHVLRNRLKVPTFPVTPSEVKLATIGPVQKLKTKKKTKKEAKDDVIGAVRKLFPECKKLTEGYRANDLPHPHDAVGTVLASLNDPVFRMAVGL